MPDLTTTPSPTSARSTRLRHVARWMVTFAGFPLGGFTALLLVGPVDSPWTALAGGVITGAVLGAVQAWGLAKGLGRAAVVPWTAATAVGMTVGLEIGAAAVDYATTLTALAAQGAVCGFAVGAAQAFVLRARIGRLALAWPPALAAIWALGWTVTTLGGIQVDQQFTVFGAYGAVTVTALTAALPLIIDRAGRSAS